MKIRKTERILLIIGLTLLAIWAAARFHRAVASRAAISRFQGEVAGTPREISQNPADLASSLKVDFQLWSIKRVEAFEDSLGKKTEAPLAILRIPKINLEVPVFNDTDDLTLNRGVGRILGTARLGERGNLGIAGHRDGFFRGLKDLGPGDEIELFRTGRSDTYVVEKIEIVNPEDVSVLKPTRDASLTLVTCFPFYYVGSAPQRFIVHASITGLGQSHHNPSQSESAVAQIYPKENQK
jgi:sortase A